MDLTPVQAACPSPSVSWLSALAQALPAASTYVNGQSIVASIAVMLAFFGYRHTRSSFRQKNSFDAQRRIISEKELKESFGVLRERNARVERCEQVESWDAIANDIHHREFGAATTLLNTFEDLAIGIKLEVFDETILRHALLTMLLRTMVVTDGFIRARQERYPFVFQHTQWLHARWGKSVFPSESQDWSAWHKAEVAFDKSIRESLQPIRPEKMARPGTPPKPFV